MSTLGAAILAEWTSLGAFDSADNQSEADALKTALAEGVAVPVAAAIVTGGGGSALTIKDEGTNKTTACTSIDFVGGEVAATNTGGAVTVTIPTVTSVSGNAGTATTLQTARKINNVSFNGSADIQTHWTLAQKPASPHASDDEFEGSGSPSGWDIGGSQQATAIDPYATFTTATQWRYSNNSMRPSWLMIQPTNDNTLMFPISKAVTVGTNFMVWGRLSFNHRSSATVAGNDNGIGIGIAATSGGAPDGNNYVALFINESDNNEKAIQIESVVGGVVTGPTEFITSNTLPLDTEYALIQKIGSTIHYWVAGSAANWLWLGSATNAASFDRAFVRCSNASTPGSPGNMIVGIDFMRFYSGADKLP